MVLGAAGSFGTGAVSGILAAPENFFSPEIASSVACQTNPCGTKGSSSSLRLRLAHMRILGCRRREKKLLNSGTFLNGVRFSPAWQVRRVPRLIAPFATG